MHFLKKITSLILLSIFAIMFAQCISDDSSDDSFSATSCDLEKEVRQLTAVYEKFAANPTPSNCESYKRAYQDFSQKAKNCKEISHSIQTLLDTNALIQTTDCSVF